MRATLVALAAGPAPYLTRPGQCNLENLEWARPACLPSQWQGPHWHWRRPHAGLLATQLPRTVARPCLLELGALAGSRGCSDSDGRGMPRVNDDSDRSHRPGTDRDYALARAPSSRSWRFRTSSIWLNLRASPARRCLPALWRALPPSVAACGVLRGRAPFGAGLT